jgi:predicted flavoprotein YhiN
MTRSSPLIVIIGAGAAGLMAAIFAAGDGRRVLVIERTRDGGRKILISGGGRCNVLPSVLAPERFVTDSSPNTMRNLLRSWPLADQRAFFENTLNLPLALEEETGKLFPVANQARAVRDALVSHARTLGVEFKFNTTVIDITKQASVDTSRADPHDPPSPDADGHVAGGATRSGDDGNANAGIDASQHGNKARWVIQLERDAPIEADAVILATGGLSVPTTGSDGTGLEIARRLGHTIHETYPALTPLVADPPVHDALAGVSLSVRMRAPVTTNGGGGRMLETAGGFLFTHRGYSGPAVLDISHAAVRARLAGERGAIPRRDGDGAPAADARAGHDNPDARVARLHAPDSDDAGIQPVFVQWTPHSEETWHELLKPAAGKQADALVRTRVRQHLPDRLADWLMRDAGVTPDQPVATLTRDVRRRLVERLTRYALPWTSDEGYRKAEVTGGGVALDEVRPKTLESRRHTGLFLCGEMLDAFGPIGGHNFAWAWATGRLAGRGAAASLAPAPADTPTDAPPA